MTVWVEWGRSEKDHDPLLYPSVPNVFSSVQNVLEYWKRTKFPADTVDYAYEAWQNHLNDDLMVGWGEDARFAKEVDLDEYFVTLAKTLANKTKETKDKNATKKAKTA